MYMFARLIINLSSAYWPLFVCETLNMHKVCNNSNERNNVNIYKILKSWGLKHFQADSSGSLMQQP